MEKIYGKPQSINDTPFGYCPGCMHSTISKIVAQVIDEMGLREKAVCVLPVGCGTLGCFTWNMDMVCSAHGRAPAVATGVKRCSPDSFVFTYQGDGDLASIGLSEIVCAANRGENFSTIFVNNSIYGMTGGQMAPTTLPGQKTQTSPYGRDVEAVGYPVKVCEMLSQVDGATYLERVAVNNVPNVKKAKAAIKKAFRNQLEGKGFSLVEVLSTCPTNWGLAPDKALAWLEENMIPYYPLGVYKDKYAE